MIAAFHLTDQRQSGVRFSVHAFRTIHGVGPKFLRIRKDFQTNFGSCDLTTSPVLSTPWTFVSNQIATLVLDIEEPRNTNLLR